MAEGRNTHWTDDDELLSKFVLRQLSPSEEEPFISHLGECEKCQHAVEKEMRVAAGTKLAGRSAMKQGLKARLKVSGSRVSSEPKRETVFQIPWMRVASLAAVLVILVAVGISNNWFTGRFWNVSRPLEQATQEQSSPRTATVEKDVTSSETKQDRDISLSTDIDKKDGSEIERTKESQDGKEKRNFDRRAADNNEAKLEGAATSPDVMAAGAREELGKGVNEARLNDEAMNHPQETFWVEGRILPSEASQRDKLSTQLKRQVFAQSKTESKSKKDQLNMFRSDYDSTSVVIALNQRTTSSLPPSQQNRLGQTGVVQTLIENRIRNIEMTLYLDSLVPDSELRSADIEAIGEDSLVLNFSNQRIGYRLPPALSEKVNSKARQLR